LNAGNPFPVRTFDGLRPPLHHLEPTHMDSREDDVRGAHAGPIAQLAACEGLDGHGRSALLRRKPR